MLIKTKKLKLVFGLLATQADEVTVRSTDTGWAIRAVDPSHTSMIDAKIAATEFVAYDTTDDFAIGLKNLIKALGNAGEDTEILMKGSSVILESDGLRSRLPLIPAAEADQKIPTIEYTAHVTVPVAELLRISNAVYGNIDSYRFAVGNDAFTVSAEDETKNGAMLMLPKSKCKTLSGEGASMFTIDMLDRFVKVLPKDGVVDIALGTDMPMEIDLNNSDICIRYLLAPRIETTE